MDIVIPHPIDFRYGAWWFFSSDNRVLPRLLDSESGFFRFRNTDMEVFCRVAILKDMYIRLHTALGRFSACRGTAPLARFKVALFNCAYDYRTKALFCQWLKNVCILMQS